MTPLQPHNGFIWNLAGLNQTAELGGASTPQRVHLEPLVAQGACSHPEASTPQRVHLEQRSRHPLRTPSPSFNPTTGSSGTVPSTSLNCSRSSLQPHNGFIWNCVGRAVLPGVCGGFNPTTGSSGTRTPPPPPPESPLASTPQRVHLEPYISSATRRRIAGFNPTTGSSGTGRREASGGTTPRFNPTTGSSGTMPGSGTYSLLAPAQHLVFPSTPNHPQTPGGRRKGPSTRHQCRSHRASLVTGHRASVACRPTVVGTRRAVSSRSFAWIPTL